MALIDDLVAYWSLDEASGNAIDAHGSNDLTDNNTVGTAAGKVGNARNFNGSDEYFSSATNPVNGSAAFSISAWVKNTRGSAAFRPDTICMCLNQPVNGDGFYLQLNGDAAGAKLRFVKAISYSAGEAVADSVISLSTWIHVVGTVSSGGVVKLYIDSVLQAVTGSKAGAMSTNPAVFFTGIDQVGGAGGWLGQIDELGFWSRELSSAEVTELFNSGNGRDYAYISGGGGVLTLSSVIGGGVGGGAFIIGA